jgi:predicted TIM-barrel fold metal-dependent hydrolase
MPSVALLLPGDAQHIDPFTPAIHAIILRVMRQSRTCQRRIQIAVFCVLLLMPLRPDASNFIAERDLSSNAPAWRADHHMHLASPELCRLVGECLSSNNPPAVFAADALRALDEAHVSKGVILSCAYLFGLPSLHMKADDLATMTRRENEFTAAQVAQYPIRLVGFLSVDPLADSAVDEVRHWRGSQQLIGLKLHFTASAVDVRNAGQRRQVAKVISVAAAEGLPMVIHLGGGKFNAADAELFIRDILPSAASAWVQIAHAGGGMPRRDGNNLAVLRIFADHIVRHDPVTQRVLFDLSYVPAPHETSETTAALIKQIRRIGIKRFLFGSDFNVLTPLQEIKDIDRFGLTRDELQTLQQNCAPWACP